MLKRTTFKLLFLAALLTLWVSGGQTGPFSGPAKLHAAAVPENGVIVYQFHRRFRCEACHILEEAINDALQRHFTEELKTGSLIYRVVDLDTKGNAHYEKEYEFFYNTVIVVDIENGTETRFKNLEEVWSMLDDKEVVIEFMRSEIAAYL